VLRPDLLRGDIMTTPVTTVLYVCVHNAGRFQMAEAFTNRLAQERGLHRHPATGQCRVTFVRRVFRPGFGSFSNTSTSRLADASSSAPTCVWATRPSRSIK